MSCCRSDLGCRSDLFCHRLLCGFFVVKHIQLKKKENSTTKTENPRSPALKGKGPGEGLYKKRPLYRVTFFYTHEKSYFT